MKMSNTIVSALAIMTVLGSASAYAASPRYYISIEGTKQGRFRGESLRRGAQDKLEGIRFNYEIVSPRDSQTGLPTGKRQHKPITITKEWGAASPQIFQALVTNEVLKNVTIEFVKASATGGAEAVYQTVRLTNATIASLRQLTDKTLAAAPEASELEEVSFTFQKIEIITPSGSAGDDWSSN